VRELTCYLRLCSVFGTGARETNQPASVWRYYLLSNRPETSDSQFTWSGFIERNNSELLNNFGNFVNRVLKFIAARYDSVVPGPSESAEVTEEDKAIDDAFFKDINASLARYRTFMDDTKLRDGLSESMRVSARGNLYLQENTLDNALFANRPDRCATVILNAVNLIYTMTAIFNPFMPATTDSMLAQLNAPPRTIPSELTIDILPGHKIGKPEHLFKRIEPKMEVEWRSRFGGETKANPGPAAVAASALGAGTAINGEVKAKEAGMSKKQLEKLKKEQKKAEAAALEAALKAKMTPEMKELDDKITVQGAKVRDLKTGKVQGDVDAEVAELVAMKNELTALVKALQETSV
jgi:methionyl-tRNA synthetase